MKLLLLDIDGVVNTHTKHDNGYCGIDHNNMYNLNRIIKETGCKIVVSSAWRYYVINGQMTLNGLEECLRTHGLYCKDFDDYHIIGITSTDESAIQISANLREAQILRHVKLLNPKTWCAVDDLKLELPATNFVQTNGSVGLHFNDVQNVLEILNG